MALKPFTMPKWGIEMREGTLAEWLVPEGGRFAKGDLIALIETDKITNEVEAEFAATLAKVIVPAGETRAVGALLGIFADAGEDVGAIEAFADSFKAADTSTAAGGAAPKTAQVPKMAIAEMAGISPQARVLAEANGLDIAGIAGSGRGGRITHQDVVQAMRPAAAPVRKGPVAVDASPIETVFASPLARRIAAQHRLDLGGLAGTGPRGRISKADVLAQVKPAAAPVATPVPAISTDNAPEILPMSAIRKTIARRLTEAKQSIPHFYLRAEVAMDRLLTLRPTANMILGCKASVNDFLVRAVALALLEVPDVNIQVHAGAIHRYTHADVAIAVASEKGLVTPIIRNADLLRLDAISAAAKALIARAQKGKLAMEDMDGGTFTISNLGMFGIDQFDAIINPPQGAILAVGATREAFVRGPDGEGRFEQRMSLSLSCDHRAIDGATGARFLAALKALIEAPERLFAS